MKKALINPDILNWAIDTTGVNVDNLGFKKLELWLKGKEKPTFKQAMEFAKKLNIPFGYLFLKEPPVSKEIIPDLRTLNNAPIEFQSPTLKALIKETKSKQEWYKEHLVENGEDGCRVVGKFTKDSVPKSVADDIIKTLNLDDIIAKSIRKDKFLKELSQRIDKVGILLMMSSVFKNNTRATLSLDEFRGFAIYDDMAPVIFINSKDSKAGMIFTIVHELAHLWIKESGISDLNNDNSIEYFCNEVAANVLMPENELLKYKSIEKDDISMLADKFSVSDFAMLNRLKNLNLISNSLYYELYKEEKEKFNSIKKGQSGGVSPYKMTKIRNSPSLTYAVVDSVLSGSTSYIDGSKILGFNNPNAISKIAKELV